MSYLLLILGLAALIAGGEFLVRGAVGFSKSLKLSPLVIGMTIVAFGTSAPELLVSLNSAMSGNPDIAIGNVVGSNIVNLTLVLGLTVLIFPIVAERQTKLIDFPVMLLATVLFYLFSLDGVISFLEGAVLFLIIIVFTVLIVRHSRKKTKLSELDAEEDAEFAEIPFWKSGTFLALGLVGLFFGSDWFIEGSVGIANTLLAGNPDREMIIGVTVVAFGTSAPELVASCVAAYRKQTDISVGNLIGSNIFNIFCVIGLTSMVKPISVANQALNYDYLWMIGVAMAMAVILFAGKRIGRLKGIHLFGSYVVYVAVILMKVKGVI